MTWDRDDIGVPRSGTDSIFFRGWGFEVKNADIANFVGVVVQMQ